MNIAKILMSTASMACTAASVTCKGAAVACRQGHKVANGLRVAADAVDVMSEYGDDKFTELGATSEAMAANYEVKIAEMELELQKKQMAAAIAAKKAEEVMAAHAQKAESKTEEAVETQTAADFVEKVKAGMKDITPAEA